MAQNNWLFSPLASSDLASQHPTENELDQLRRQQQLILNAVGEGVYGLDLNGMVTFVNPAAAAMIDWPMDELVGKSMHTVLHHSHPDGSHYPREDCPIYKAFQDGSVHRVTDEVFWRKDGTSFPVEYISTPMHDEAGVLIGAVITFRDISQRRWAEEVLRRTNEELELKVQARTAKLRAVNLQLRELSEMRSRFVSMVCHEFRNPLNNISLLVSSLQRYTEQLSLEQKNEYIEDVKINVERMTQMIDDILVIGKIEAKVLDVQPKSLDVVAFCQAILSEQEYRRIDQPIQFICQDSSLVTALDPQLLRSILSNLLSNAIRYTPGEENISLTLERQQGYIVFQVEDHGIGIPLEDHPHLFDPFHRGRNVSNVPGTGLGLSIVKQFVDLQHGSIEVESQIEEGTIFTIKLPEC